MRTIKRGSRGAAVEDVQQRLRLLGYSLAVDGNYLDRTQAAVTEFRDREGLAAGDFIDEVAWKALVDATFALGDRMLYLRMPYFHGHDVHSLQNILNALGFIMGEADGIFGAHTEHALREFQASVGLIDDGVAGPSTYDAIQRLHHAWEGKSAVTEPVDEHRSFARAAEVLEDLAVCFFGMDDASRQVARRAANLAHATSPFAHVNSADQLSVAPAPGTIMCGIADVSAEPSLPDDVHEVSFAEDPSFAQRLRTALAALEEGNKRLFIIVPLQPPAQYAEVGPDRWWQHVAIAILDALCEASG